MIPRATRRHSEERLENWHCHRVQTEQNGYLRHERFREGSLSEDTAAVWARKLEINTSCAHADKEDKGFAKDWLRFRKAARGEAGEGGREATQVW